MVVYICTDMEGLAGISHWDQCYDPDDDSPIYRYGREQLTADANAAIAGCFDGGATEVRILDGHGRNHNRGFIEGILDSRARLVWIAERDPLRWEGLDEDVDALAVIGQHAMACTQGAFLDHTQSAKTICEYRINGCPVGEPAQMALYAGHYGVPFVYLSGEETACTEARRLFPHIGVTPTKQGVSWDTCRLYDVDEVRANIRRDIADAVRRAPTARAWTPSPPVQISVEWCWCGGADAAAGVDGVTRHGPRTASWWIDDLRDVFNWPSAAWSPAAIARSASVVTRRAAS